mgnify:FL=1
MMKDVLESSALEIVEGETFGQSAEIVIDRRHFKNCRFLGCVLLYSGGDSLLTDCEILNVSVSLSGNAATTIQFLLSLGYTDLTTMLAIPSSVH